MPARGRDLTLLAVAVGGADRRVGAARPGRAAAHRARPLAVGHLRAPTSPAALLLGYAGTRLMERLPPSTYRRPFVGTGRLRRPHHLLGLPAGGGRARRATVTSALAAAYLVVSSRSAWPRSPSRPASCAAPAWCPRERAAACGSPPGRSARSARWPASRSTARSARRVRGDMPWGTLAVNVTRRPRASASCAGAGVDGDARFLVAGGLIGSFTTFSTWMFETQRLAEEGEERLAARQPRRCSVALGIARGGARLVDRVAAVSAEALKMVVHVGEAGRIGGRLASDALMDLVAGAGVASAVLLRGVEGFGARHRLRTDRLLSPVRGPAPGARGGRSRRRASCPWRTRSRGCCRAGCWCWSGRRCPGLQLDDDTVADRTDRRGEADRLLRPRREHAAAGADAVAEALRAAGLAGAIVADRRGRRRSSASAAARGCSRATGTCRRS